MIEKPTTTSAASTAFCAEKVEGPGGYLWVDGNGKITRDNGTLDQPKPNAFSLVHIDDCPQSTPTCRASCYVHGLERHAKTTHDLYRHNSAFLRGELQFSAHISFKFREREEWAKIMADWISKNAAGGFRWHVSGDVFSAMYAYWIGRVCGLSPEVPQWVYTRSFSYLPILAAASTLVGGNLAVNLSCDKDNYIEALRARHAIGLPLRLCYLTDDGTVPRHLPEDAVVFPDYKLRGGTSEGRAWFEALQPSHKRAVCPVDYHGKSEERRCGPCARCLT